MWSSLWLSQPYAFEYRYPKVHCKNPKQNFFFLSFFINKIIYTYPYSTLISPIFFYFKDYILTLSKYMYILCYTSSHTCLPLNICAPINLNILSPSFQNMPIWNPLKFCNYYRVIMSLRVTTTKKVFFIKKTTKTFLPSP